MCSQEIGLCVHIDMLTIFKSSMVIVLNYKEGGGGGGGIWPFNEPGIVIRLDDE
jgi:hypothetical protein